MTSRRSPRPTSNVTSANTSSGPNDFQSSVAVSTVRPAVGGSGNCTAFGAPALPGRRRARLRSGRPGCRSSCATRARLAVWPRIGSASVAEACDLLACRAAIAVWRSSSRSRAVRYCEYVPLYSTSVPVPSSASRSTCTTRVIASSSRSRSWLTTSSAPRYVRRNLSSQVRASASRWLVGSSSSSSSLPAKRMRTSSTPAPLTAGERAEGEVETVVGEADAGGELAHLRLGRVPAVRLELLLRGPEALDVAARRCLPPSRPAAFSSRVGELVEPAPGEHVGEAVGVVGHRVGAGVLREVAGGAGPPDLARPGARWRRRAPAAAWSCRRRCDRRGRPCRPAAPATTPGRRSACLRPRPRGPARSTRGELQGNCGRGGTIVTPRAPSPGPLA